jgi:hypothetical protein
VCPTTGGAHQEVSTDIIESVATCKAESRLFKGQPVGGMRLADLPIQRIANYREV